MGDARSSLSPLSPTESRVSEGLAPVPSLSKATYIVSTTALHSTSNGKNAPDPSPDRRLRALGWIVWRILWPLLRWGLIVSLQFVALLRGTLYAYQQHWPTPLALLAGFAAAFLVLLLYTIWAYVRVIPEGMAVRGRTVQRQTLAVLLGLSMLQGYLLLAPDPVHVKSAETATEYAELHPLLRMSVGTFLLVDDGLLITDLSRQPGDYADMGLPVKSHSLHYRQADGYAHAFDLRTKGHSWLRNVLTQRYFELLGFRTLRHVGTADHLHVALPLPPE